MAHGPGIVYRDKRGLGGHVSEIDDTAQWLTVNEVAQHYRVSKRTIGRWAASGQIRSKRVGHRTGIRTGVIRIHRSVIETDYDTPSAAA